MPLNLLIEGLVLNAMSRGGALGNGLYSMVLILPNFVTF